MAGPQACDAAPHRLWRAAVTTGCVLVIFAGLWLAAKVMVRLAPLSLAVVAAVLLAALLGPLTERGKRIGLPAWLVALAAATGLLALVTGALFLVGRRTAAQVDDLQARLRDGLDRLRELLAAGPLPISRTQLDRIGDQVVEAGRHAAPGPVGGATTAVQVLTAIALAVLLLFFLLRDGTQMWCWSVRLFPERRRVRIDAAARAGWAALVSYTRGTVIVAAVDGVGVGIALLVLDVPLALSLALLTFLTAFVPIVGATLAGAAAVLVTLVTNGLRDALIVLAAVIAVQQIEGNLLQPLIVGRAVRLHPAVILVAVTAGTLTAGVAGALVAVPATAFAYRFVAALVTPAPESDDPPDNAAG